MLARIVLVIVGLSFAGFGVWFMAAPDMLLAMMYPPAESSTAMTEVRAFYGGFELAFGLFLLAAAVKTNWQSAALALVVLTMIGISSGRFIGLALDGYNQQMLVFAIVEVFFAGGALLALMLRKRV